MKQSRWAATLITVFVATGFCSAPAGGDSPALESFTDEYAAFREQLGEQGIDLNLGYTQIYQINTHGGRSTHRRSGRFSGSYDVELEADLQKLLGLEDSRLYMLIEGGYSDGIDPASVGSAFGVNDDAIGYEAMQVSELWYETLLPEYGLTLRAGKIDLTGGFECRGCPGPFDGNAYANDETTQFLNGALVNNPAIPFPDYGLAVIAHYNPVQWWYASVGAADAQADARETGFNTAFHDEDYFFYIAETGITPQLDSSRGPLQGAYRLGVWYDPRDKAEFDTGRTQRDDTGFYASCGQMLYKENADLRDNQGLGAFARFGWADSEVNELTNFYSFGLQYEGLFEGRSEDVIAAGFAQGVFSDEAGFAEDYESVVEVYYNAAVTTSLNVTPSLQYVTNPGGQAGTSDAVIAAVRAQMTF